MLLTAKRQGEYFSAKGKWNWSSPNTVKSKVDNNSKDSYRSGPLARIWDEIEGADGDEA